MTADPDDPDVAESESDRVLMLAMRAWAPSPRIGSGPAEDPRARLLARLDPSWTLRLKQADDPDPPDRPEARRQLREAHQAEARVDLDRVHPSWWERALREESPAVRRAVVASAPETIRGEVQSALLLDNDDIRPDRPPNPEALSWACSLWTERLVGGEPSRPDDPPVIVAMSRLSLRASYRLCRKAGILKLALAGEPQPEWAADFAGSAGPEFALIARHDLKSTPPNRYPRRRLPARLGLLTIARLLSLAEPFRVRWALQHWPYAIARQIRPLMPPPSKRTPVMMQVESTLFRTAQDRLSTGR